jgi:hypothetical protein
MPAEDDVWPEWANSNAYTPFSELMSLQRTDHSEGDQADEQGGWTFLSRRPAYSPGGFTRAYGGHVYAQAALAAARTVRAGFVLHVGLSSLSPFPFSCHARLLVRFRVSAWTGQGLEERER